MTREEFFEWLDTCPGDWEQISDDCGATVITFTYEEVEEEED